MRGGGGTYRCVNTPWQWWRRSGSPHTDDMWCGRWCDRALSFSSACRGSAGERDKMMAINTSDMTSRQPLRTIIKRLGRVEHLYNNICTTLPIHHLPISVLLYPFFIYHHSPCTGSQVGGAYPSGIWLKTWYTSGHHKGEINHYYIKFSVYTKVS